MSLALTEIPAHIHDWQTFSGGRGCATCEAWISTRVGSVWIDALPTSLLEQPPRSVQDDPVPSEPVDLQLEVMSDLLELVSSAPVGWNEVESMATRIIERVRAR